MLRSAFMAVLIVITALTAFAALRPKSYREWKVRICRIPGSCVSDESEQPERRSAAIAILLVCLFILFAEFR